jgi:hypothetical protein
MESNDLAKLVVFLLNAGPMKPRLFTSNQIARAFLWLVVLLAAVSTLGFSRADSSPLPDAPSTSLLKNLILIKMPSFELRLQPQIEVGDKDVVVNDISFNPSLPTSVNDLSQSSQAYENALSAITSAAPDQTWDALIASTKKDCPSMTPNGMVALLSFYGNAFDQNYNPQEPWTPTPLNAVATSLIAQNHNAGVCRDIHTALAQIAAACGMEDVGEMFVNWQRDGADIAHSPGYYKDPKSGQYIIINYGDEFNTGTKSLSQAADIAGQQLSPTTMAAYVQTGTSSMHEILTARGAGILGSVDHASNLSKTRPRIEISVGNLNISGSVQARHTVGGGLSVGVYGTADDNRETGTLFGSAGGMIAEDAHVTISNKVDFNSDSQLTMGVFDIHDKDFENNIRNAFEGIILIKTENGLAWHTEHAPGSLTATLEQADNFSPHTIGVPYNFVSLRLVVDPTQYVRVHAQTTEIITTKTIQNTAFALRPIDDSAGVDFKKILRNGSVDSDTTVHLLGTRGAVGEEEKAKVTLNTRAGSFATGGSVLAVQNNSADYFYNVPVFCRAKVEYDKTIKGIDIQASADYRCNHDRQLSIPGEQSLGSGEEWDIYKPRGTLGLKVSWGNQGKTVEK